MENFRRGNELTSDLCYHAAMMKSRLTFLTTGLLASILLAGSARAVLPPRGMPEVIAQHAEVYDVKVLEIIRQDDVREGYRGVIQDVKGEVVATLKGDLTAGAPIRLRTWQEVTSTAYEAYQARRMPGPAYYFGPGLVSSGQVARVFFRTRPPADDTPHPVSLIATPDAKAVMGEALR